MTPEWTAFQKINDVINFELNLEINGSVNKQNADTDLFI